jgi:hypothetical protein
MSKRSNSCCVGGLSGIRPSVLFKRAKKEFGTTRDPYEAGWILPDGSMLDFSEKNEGGPSGQRSLDHRAVARLFPRKEYDEFDRQMGGQSRMMLEFCYRGAIRMSLQPGLFSADVCRPMTGAQREVMRRAASNATEAVVDIECPHMRGETPSKEWGEGAARFHPDAVTNWAAQMVERCPKRRPKRRR